MMEQTFKIVMLGNLSVGKSSLIAQLVGGGADAGAPTFSTYSLNVAGLEWKMQIWDTAGQERYGSLASMYYRRARGALVVYDITDRGSFSAAGDWMDELKRCESEACVVLVGNKCDLDSSRLVPFDEAKAYADSRGALFMETSSTIPVNVDKVFQELCYNLVKDMLPKVPLQLHAHMEDSILKVACRNLAGELLDEITDLVPQAPFSDLSALISQRVQAPEGRHWELIFPDATFQPLHDSPLGDLFSLGDQPAL